MKAVCDGDIVVGFADGDLDGPVIPDRLLGLPSARLRVDGSVVIDAAAISVFYIDVAGRKHIAGDALGEWQMLACAWDATLARDDAAWVVLNETGRVDAVKETLKREIDELAERIRTRYITPGSGQAMTYQRKGDEARAFLAWRAANAPDAVPVPGDYPIMSATIGIEGASLDDIASLVTATEAAWLQVSAAIETARLGGKAAVSVCPTEATARAAAAAIVWPQ